LTRDELANCLTRCGKGDRVALSHFYAATSAKLFGVIVRILAERAEAEDVLQDVYVTIWSKAAEFDPARASPITWAATIARNRAIDRFRSRGRRPTAPIEAAWDVADDSEAADAALERSDEAKRLQAALSKLEPRAAAAIRAAFFEGATYQTLAARAGMPEGTMKSLIRRGLLAMRKELAA
jgi:RNA polymerase sigma-70 factor (ECF subfamily)